MGPGVGTYNEACLSSFTHSSRALRPPEPSLREVQENRLDAQEEEDHQRGKRTLHDGERDVGQDEDRDSRPLGGPIEAGRYNSY